MPFHTDIDFKNQALSNALFEYAMRSTVWQDMFPVPRLTRWQLFRLRLSNWWYDHRPRFHFGPCEDDGDE